MSKAEILAELPQLSAEERAEVQAKLDELARNTTHERQCAQIRSPRLANPQQSRDFKKQIVEPGREWHEHKLSAK